MVEGDGNFRVLEDRWRLADGTELGAPLVRSPSFAVAVGVTEEHQIPLVRNLHPTPGLRLLELPGGRLDPNETPRSAARRELEEETGWTARKLSRLGRYYPNPHWGTFAGHVYLAEQLQAGETHPDVGESLRPVLVPVREVYRRLHRGRFFAGSTIIGLTMAEEPLRGLGLLPRGGVRP